MFPCNLEAPSPPVQTRQGGSCLRPPSSVLLATLNGTPLVLPLLSPGKKKSVGGTRGVGDLAATPHAVNRPFSHVYTRMRAGKHLHASIRAHVRTGKRFRCVRVWVCAQSGTALKRPHQQTCVLGMGFALRA
jgi:hypothetical protein